jgi:hypothetical protein
MLNDGQRLWTVATSDAHEVTLGGVGGWRTYVRSGSDMPGAIDPQEIVDNAKRGRMFVTTGPFLQVSTADGQGPGDTIAGRSRLSLQIRVQCNSWTDVDRVTVLINGRPGAGLDFRKAEHPEMFASGTLRFDRSIDLQLKSDAHIIVVAAGESSTLATGYGHSWQSRLHPVAYHNPLFVDVEGNGFEPNHDTLGLPYLVYGRTPGTSRPAR